MAEYTQKQRETERNNIMSKLGVLLKQIGTVQGNAHNLLIDVVLYTFKNRSDLSVVTSVMNSITSHKGSFRVESIGYWLTEVAGVSCTVKDNVWACKLNRDSSKHGVEFTYDRKHLDRCKEDGLRFWIIAPVVMKELKIADDLDKVTSSAETQLARALAAGKISEDALALHVSNMVSRIRQLAGSGKTKDFLEEFYASHPDQRPVLRQLEDELNEERSIVELEGEVITASLSPTNSLELATITA